jgi:hypothetical protein
MGTLVSSLGAPTGLLINGVIFLAAATILLARAVVSLVGSPGQSLSRCLVPSRIGMLDLPRVISVADVPQSPEPLVARRDLD